MIIIHVFVGVNVIMCYVWLIASRLKCDVIMCYVWLIASHLKCYIIRFGCGPCIQLAKNLKPFSFEFCFSFLSKLYQKHIKHSPQIKINQNSMFLTFKTFLFISKKKKTTTKIATQFFWGILLNMLQDYSNCKNMLHLKVI